MSLLVDWKADDFDALENRVLVARHAIAELPMFTDEGLAELLDAHPEAALSLNTMGNGDDAFEWREGGRNGVSGKDMLEIVKRGKLWINCRQVMQCQPELAKHVNAIFDELELRSPHFRAEQRTANLLISSPTAVVHYHVDMPVNMLWHLRGRKRVWVYPHFDHRFASQESLEQVCAGVWSEEIPYSTDWDKYALVFDAQPGDLISWPQLAPHRVCNLAGLNVSLSTEHKNPRARRRLNVHEANHLLRTRLGMQPKSDAVDGLAAHLKQFIARASRLAGKLKGDSKQRFAYPKSFVLDPSVFEGIRLLENVEAAAPHLDTPAKVA